MLDRLVFDTLTSVDERGAPVPILALAVPSRANGDLSPDGMRIRFRLRRDVRWQDGVPFTSRDVAFTCAALRDARNDVGARGAFDFVRSVAPPDAHTVVFTLKRPFAPALQTLFGESDQPVAILPAHAFAAGEDLNRSAFNARPIGTGPFRLKEWRRDEPLAFEANPAYFRGAPKPDRIEARVIPDERTAAAMLQAGEIDWFFEPSSRVYARLAQDPHLRTRLYPTNQYAGLQLQTERGPLRDVRVRRAIALAIDKAALVARYTNGSAVPADQDLPPWR